MQLTKSCFHLVEKGGQDLMHLFQEEITDWGSWGNVYQSIPAFAPLIQAIMLKETGVDCKESIEQVTPGTNAVFKVGPYVLKIFAPIESGLNTEIDYHAELSGMRKAHALGIHAPRIIAASNMQDKYLFRYILMDYVEGTAAGAALKSCAETERMEFVRQLRLNMSKLNISASNEQELPSVYIRAMHNPRWNSFSSVVRDQVLALLQAYDTSELIYVHGDLTADNVIISGDGDIYIIDYADSSIAPLEYEYPPILFDLFDCDPDLIRAFAGDTDREAFVEKCFYGVLMHDYGANFVKLLLERFTEKDASQLSDIREIKAIIERLI
ncbi:phosphotransferase family protein [Paenibacillus marinisediminis]